ncbi:FAD/NAD(P)-binding domain-containing protein, partial [Conidiobolus coronatus NRRL 28638]
MVSAERKQTKIAVIGGNYGGLGFVNSLLQMLDLQEYNIKVTIFDKRQGFCHLVGVTRALIHKDFAKQIWINHSELSWFNNPNIEFNYGTVTKVTEKTVENEGGKHEDFDFIVVATGYGRPGPIWPESKVKGDYLDEFQVYREKIEAAGSVAVIGAGAVGVELSADIKSHFPEKQVTLIHSRKLPIVGPYTEEFKSRVSDELKEIGVELLFENRVLSQSERIENGKTVFDIKTNQGVELTADLILNCVGAGAPVTDILDLESTEEYPLLDDKKLVKILPTIQLKNPKYSHIFAIGDINDWQEVKLAGASMYQAHFTAKNIKAILDTKDGELPKLENYPDYFLHLVLFLGEHHGIGEMEEGIVGWDKVKEFGR